MLSTGKSLSRYITLNNFKSKNLEFVYVDNKNDIFITYIVKINTRGLDISM